MRRPVLVVGGPSSHLPAADHPDRVSSLVACASVSGPHEFASVLASLENSPMTSGLGGWLLHEVVVHTPKEVGNSTIKEEGTLSHGDVGIDHRDRATEHDTGAEFRRVENGSHLAAWTDPTSAAIPDLNVHHLQG